MRITIDDMVAEGDTIAIRWKVKMTHEGDSLGGASFLRCQGGKIVEGWNYMDFTRVRQELQAPADAQPKTAG